MTTPLGVDILLPNMSADREQAVARSITGETLVRLLATSSHAIGPEPGATLRLTKSFLFLYINAGNVWRHIWVGFNSTDATEGSLEMDLNNSRDDRERTEHVLRTICSVEGTIDEIDHYDGMEVPLLTLVTKDGNVHVRYARESFGSKIPYPEVNLAFIDRYVRGDCQLISEVSATFVSLVNNDALPGRGVEYGSELIMHETAIGVYTVQFQNSIYTKIDISTPLGLDGFLEETDRDAAQGILVAFFVNTEGTHVKGRMVRSTPVRSHRGTIESWIDSIE